MLVDMNASAATATGVGVLLTDGTNTAKWRIDQNPPSDPDAGVPAAAPLPQRGRSGKTRKRRTGGNQIPAAGSNAGGTYQTDSRSE
jgi:type 1 fimbria pilin